jgi:hypothetical protein
MGNRWCHIFVPTPTADEWGEWLTDEGQRILAPIDKGQERVVRNWPKEWAIARGYFRGFIKRFPQHLHELPPEGSKDRGLAWPSPRTNVWAARSMATCACLATNEDKYTDVRDILLKGCIGQGATIALLKWLKEADLPTPEEVLKNGWKPDKDRLDRCIAVYSSLITYVLTLPVEERKKVAAGAWRVIEQSDKAGGLIDMTATMAKKLVHAGLDEKCGVKEVTEVSKPILLRLAKSKVIDYMGS